MLSAAFAIAASCSARPALGARRGDARVVVGATPCPAPLLDVRALATALEVELGEQGASKVVVRVASANEPAARGEDARAIVVEVGSAHCAPAADVVAFSIRAPNAADAPVAGEVALRDVGPPERARVTALAIAEKLRSELQRQIPAVAWTAKPASTEDAAEAASDAFDPDDDEVPWWRSHHLRIEAAARVGGDIWIGSAGPGVHTVSSLGAGGEAGVALDRIHLGLSAMYYLTGDGSSESPVLRPFEGDVSYSSLLLGTELGYDLRVGIWTLRPQLGFGAHELHAVWADFGNRGVEHWDAYFEPGVTTFLKLGFVTLGLDANVLLVTTPTQGYTPTFTAHGQLGVALP